MWLGEGPNLLTALSFFVFILWFIHQYTNLCNGQIYFKHIIQPGSQALPVTVINLQKCLLYFTIVLVNFCSCDKTRVTWEEGLSIRKLSVLVCEQFPWLMVDGRGRSLLQAVPPLGRVWVRKKLSKPWEGSQPAAFFHDLCFSFCREFLPANGLWLLD